MAICLAEMNIKNIGREFEEIYINEYVNGSGLYICFLEDSLRRFRVKELNI